jgi:tRNA threonylcarbamoyladenosine biosynthesis protein TsaB
MSSILNIETATQLCSVTLAVDGKVISQRETLEEKSHAARLTVFIEEVLKEGNVNIDDLDAIAVGKGPGSYTGLRIGVSTAKGLCYGANLPLIAIDTLSILFKQVVTHSTTGIQKLLTCPDTLFCPMIDARRMEVFTCLFDSQGGVAEPVAARIIDQHTFQQHFAEHTIVFFGSGMEKCRDVLYHPKAVFISGVFPHSSSLALLAEEKFIQSLFENIAYFEPFYLKDFIATTSKKGLLV